IYNFDEEGLVSSIMQEEINLNYSYKCFSSKNLEKRIKGITYIDKIVEIVDKREIQNKLLGVSNRNTSITNEENYYCPLDSNYLFSWLKEKKVLEIILGETIHEEIIKRTSNIFLMYV